MLKKFLLTACLLALCHSCFAEVETTAAVLADGAHITAAYTAGNRDNGYEDYRHAWSRYNDALKAWDDVPQKTEAFNDAIKAINLATTKDAENPSYWLLDSRIYRSRGGVAYAKNFFAKACALYEQLLEKDPTSVTYNLQYAIACYAGDAQFYSDYSSYKVKAVQHTHAALQTIDMLEKDYEKKWFFDAVEDEFLEEKFLAYVILHDYKSLAKLREQIDNNYKEPDNLYYMSSDYENLVLQGKWHWKVNNKESAEKAFLMYYLHDWMN